MSKLVLIVFLLFIAVAVAVVVPRVTGKKVTRLIAALPALLAVFAFAGTLFTQVHAKELGVKTSFGRPVGELGPGLHFKAPWQSVTKIDETIFTDTYSGSTAIPVRLGDGNTAAVNATIRWHVDPAAADYIYASYHSNNPAESLRDAVVDTQFKAVVNQVLSGFNPTASLSSTDLLNATKSLNFSPNYSDLATQITAAMKGRVTDADGTSLITMDGITVAGIQYSQATEDRINSIISQVAKTQQAIQSQATATAQAKANDILEKSLKQNPYVLVSKCLDDLANGSFTPPAGFSCWPSSGSAVVIPSAQDTQK